jgi:hypothetical protein
MTFGICTNHPSNCPRAKSHERISMEEHGTRCPEPGCGMPLLPVEETPAAWRRRLPAGVAAVVAVVALLVGYEVFYQMFTTRPPSTTVSGLTSGSSESQPAPDQGTSTALADDPALLALTHGSAASEDASSNSDSDSSQAVNEGGTGGASAAAVSLSSGANECSKELVVWDHASCPLVTKCWMPEDECDLSNEACRHINDCLGVQNVATNPGVQKGVQKGVRKP